jgi:uncharacterized membrane protein
MPRPKIKLPYSQPEKLIQILSFLALLGLIILTVFSMNHLPDNVPTHFGADGRADAWGGKSSLLLFPILGSIFYAAFTILERFPWIYNYPVEITEENASYQYKLGRQLLEWMKLIILAIFLYIQWQSVQVARGLSNGLGSWLLPVFLVAMFGVIGYIIYKMSKQY